MIEAERKQGTGRRDGARRMHGREVYILDVEVVRHCLPQTDGDSFGAGRDQGGQIRASGFPANVASNLQGLRKKTLTLITTLRRTAATQNQDAAPLLFPILVLACPKTS